MFAPAADPARGQYLVYVGTYTDHGSKGIYVYRFDCSAGKLSSLSVAAETTEPSFLAVDSSGRSLYAANETPTYNGLSTGAVSAFAIHRETGKLSFLNQVSSRGELQLTSLLIGPGSTRWSPTTPLAAWLCSPC